MNHDKNISYEINLISNIIIETELNVKKMHIKYEIRDIYYRLKRLKIEGPIETLEEKI